MLQIIIKKIADFCLDKNRWWVPLITGLFFALCLPPFNSDFNPLFFLFPLISFVILIPLMFFALLNPLKKAILYTFLYSFSAAMVQFYWIGFVTAEGLWHLILFGLVLISAAIGLIFLTAGMLFRMIYRTAGRLYILIFPSIWICIDLARTLTDIAFPWSFLGYSLTTYLPTAQFASITGVWGLTFLIVLGNILIFEILSSYYKNENQVQKYIHAAIFLLFMIVISVWGYSKMKRPLSGSKIKMAIIQTNIDQLHWGNNSLDTAFDITERMVHDAAKQQPELIIGPESALLCFLDRKSEYRRRVAEWVDEIRIPVLLGALHWEIAPKGSVSDYDVFNTAFLIEPGNKKTSHYNKQQLVPFSEKMPFENLMPILSRVNLGEADFKRGKDPVVFTTVGIKAAPFICYEIIFPSFVQKRLKKGANCIVAITNDGWFGKTSGPYQHANMARMRAIENRISIVRCANSGFSMFIDPYGRIQQKTKLYTRDILHGEALLKNADTFYARNGDWFLLICAFISVSGLLLSLCVSLFRKK